MSHCDVLGPCQKDISWKFYLVHVHPKVTVSFHDPYRQMCEIPGARILLRVDLWHSGEDICKNIMIEITTKNTENYLDPCMHFPHYVSKICITG